MKTEPSVFSFQDLQKVKRTSWEGVRNYQARNHLKSMKVGDLAFIYHSGVEDPEIAGIATVVKEAYPDPAAADPKSKYFDERAKNGSNPWVMVDIEFKQAFPKIVLRSDLKKNKSLKDLLVLKKGMRLSVLPVTEKEFAEICKMGGI